MPSSSVVPIELSDAEREQLESWSQRRTTAQALALWSRIVLLVADGLRSGHAEHHALIAELRAQPIVARRGLDSRCVRRCPLARQGVGFAPSARPAPSARSDADTRSLHTPR